MRLLSASIAAVALFAAAAGCGSQDEGTRPPSQTRSGAGGGSQGPGSAVPTAPPGAAARICPPSGGEISAIRVTGVDCATGSEVAAAWSAAGSCSSPPGASRHSCRLDGWRCGSVAAERAEAVSCARPGRSVAFLARR